MRIAPQSIFNEHYNRLVEITEPTTLELEIIDVVSTSKLSTIEKRKIEYDVKKCNKNLARLQSYLTNSMLKFNGLGVLK